MSTTVSTVLLARSCRAVISAFSLALLAGVSGALFAAEAKPFEIQSDERIVLIGDTLIEREQLYGFVEQRLTAQFPDRNAIFRNLGWSADTPKAISRASFDFEEPEKGFERLKDQLKTLQPTLVILGYGMASSFETNAAAFKTEMQALMEVVRSCTTNQPVRFIILSPIRHEDLGRPLPDPISHNRQLESYTAALRELAVEQKSEFISLFDLLRPIGKGRSTRPLTDNGIHLSPLGYACAADAVARGLGWQPSGWQVEVPANGLPKTAGTTLSGLKRDSQSVEFDAMDQQLVDPTVQGKLPEGGLWKMQVAGLRSGFYELRIDGKLVASAMGSEWKSGVRLERGPQFDQAEELRQTIVRKNVLYFDRWRPQNETYLFGFRKHEQGQNAKEIPMFDPLIAEQEKKIAELRRPVRHHFELKYVAENKPRFAPIQIGRSAPGAQSGTNATALSPRPEFDIAPGFEVNLYAESPLLAKPIQINFDPQGRLWVASSAVYPQIQPGQVADDKILVLEDTNGDGFAEKSTVFADGLLIPSAVIPGDGGAYVGQSTMLLHFRDRDGDGKAEEKRVVLSGFGTEDTHHMVHTLRWGPDGRLYFNQSIYIHSHFETPNGVVRLNSGGVWRMHPPTVELEVLLRGFCNPWGHAFDEFGQSFETDGAGFQGLSYGLPGATYFTYASMRREMQSISAGNYPKFCGLELIQSSQFPDDWQGDAITCDFRAHKVVRFKISEQGAGYVAKQGADLLVTTNVTFRPIDVKLGPDGALYIADWSNPIIQHGEVDFRDPRRDHEHGRIWRVTAKGRPLVPRMDLASASNAALLREMNGANGFQQQQARRVLAERGRSIRHDLDRWVTAQSDERVLLAGLWMYEGIDVVEPTLLEKLLRATDGRVRAAATRVLAHWHGQVKNAVALFSERLADENPRVRLEAMRGIALIRDWHSAELVLAATEKPMDPFLDYAAWLSINELAEPWLAAVQDGRWKIAGREKQLEFGLKAIEPAKARPVLAKVLSGREIPRDGSGPWIELIAAAGDETLLRQLFDQASSGGFEPDAAVRALNGLATAARQSNGKAIATRAELDPLLSAGSDSVRAAALRLAGAWKLRDAIEALAQTAGESQTPPEVRKAAFAGLREIGGKRAADALAPLAAKPHAAEIRKAAVLALGAINLERASQPAVELLLESKSEEEAAELWRSLLGIKGASTRLAHALPKTGLPPLMAKAGLRVAREGGRNEPDLVWALTRGADLEGEAQSLSPAEMAELAAAVGSKGDPVRGEQIFRRKEMACLTCHAIGGSGGKVGPDLTSIGASAPVDYLIESLLYPNRKIKEGYHSVIVETKDGLEFSGVLVRENSDSLVLRDATDKETTIAKSDIEKRATGNSLMPSGLVDPLSPAERLDLFRFLSELGKPGRYDASKPNTARSWKLLVQTLEVAQFGDAKVLESEWSDSRWTPARAWVDGSLTKQDLLAVLEGLERRDPQGIYASTRFDVSKTGTVRFEWSGPDGTPIWIDGKPVRSGTSLAPELSAGAHRLVLRLDARRLPDAIHLRSADASFLVDK